MRKRPENENAPRAYPPVENLCGAYNYVARLTQHKILPHGYCLGGVAGEDEGPYGPIPSFLCPGPGEA